MRQRDCYSDVNKNNWAKDTSYIKKIFLCDDMEYLRLNPFPR